MKKIAKTLTAIVMAAAMMVVCGGAYDCGEVAPGEVYSIDKGEFYNRASGYVLDSSVSLNDSNFTISSKTIKKGSSYVDKIKINSRTQSVQVVFKDDVTMDVPNSPNVVISKLALKALRSVRDGSGGYIMRSGDIFIVDDEIEFHLGVTAEDVDMYRGGVDIYLDNGDSRYIRWRDGNGDGYGTVTVEYGNMLVGTSRVFEDDKVLYSYSNEIDDKLQDNNYNAYITAVDMGSAKFPTAMKIQLLASRSDYIYEYNGTQLKAATGLKWDSDEDAWVGSLTSGKHYIISDTRLRSVSGSTTGGNSSSDDSSSSSSGSGNQYYNPNTGGSGGNVAVAVSAIVAIVAIAMVSIIMSTILSVKKMKKDE